MPVTMVESPSVISTGVSSGAVGLAAPMRSTSEAIRMPVTAAVELSGPATANGSELPSAIKVASTADEMNVAAMPYDR